MKRNRLVAVGLGCLLSVCIMAVFAGRGSGGRQSTAVPVLSEAEQADLMYMREEEKLARDVYNNLYEAWGTRVFDNISRSEQNHMDAMLGLIEKYGLVDPALEPDQFTNPHLQELFEELIERGLGSRLEALRVGALIEEIDMTDILDAMERTDRKDILTVYGNLLNGSVNHLIAFVWNIEAITGETYEAQHLTQEELDDILGR